MQLNNFLMLNVGFASHDGDWNFTDINSPFSRIYLVTEGSAEVEIEGKTHNLTPGHMYIIPAFNTHTDKCTGIFKHYYAHIYEESGSGDDILTSYDFPFEIEARDIDRLLFESLAGNNGEMILKSSDPRKYDNKNSLIECVKFNRRRPIYVRMESMGIISQFLGRFMEYGRPKYQTSDRRIRQALKVITDNIDRQINIDEIAANLCMSKGHFIRLFKHEVGCTPVQFIIDRKIMRAKLMLASESIMAKEIAYKLGYGEVSYFTRLFKKQVGMTPLEYRHSYNKNP